MEAGQEFICQLISVAWFWYQAHVWTSFSKPQENAGH